MLVTRVDLTNSKCDQIKHRDMRFFLGVHKYAPVPGLQSDMERLLFLLIAMYLWRDSKIVLLTWTLID